jgi:hypothetical protein
MCQYGNVPVIVLLSWVTACEEVIYLFKGNNKIISFSQTQQYFIIYFKLLETGFGR